MNSKAILLSIIFTFLIIASFNFNGADASHSHSHHGIRKCVKCKFGLIECCEPDICESKLLRPDKCIRIKT